MAKKAAPGVSTMEHIVRMENIVKRFEHVLANDSVSLKVRKGEIHCLLGENGAGKTTLMNILYGLYEYDRGTIFIRDRKVVFHNPLDAIRSGIGMVHQHFMLIPVFTVLENFVLGSEPRKGLRIDRRKAVDEIGALSEKYGLRVDPSAHIHDISVGMQQRVEILKLLYRGAEIMILDEPTSVLTPQEIEELYNVMNFLRKTGHTLIFITHKLKEVMDISDRVSVLRDGKLVDTIDTVNTTTDKLANMMVGRQVLFRVSKPAVKVGKVVMDVKNIHALDQRNLPALKGTTFSVREGEIVGIAGVDGNGQTELVEVLTGLRKVTAGEVTVEGKNLTNKKAHSFLQAGVAHIPEDRQKRGLILDFTLYENLVLGLQDRSPFAKGILLDYTAVKEVCRRLTKEFDIRASDSGTLLNTLSGGNQQKVVLAREFYKNPRLLIAAQPTRGLDVGATEFIHQQIVRICNAGRAVVLVSLDLNEIISLSDRILVIFDGKIQGAFNRGDADMNTLGLLMAGVSR
jgi:ABC-type uncharacterized transport system ATPase subunit